MNAATVMNIALVPGSAPSEKSIDLSALSPSERQAIIAEALSRLTAETSLNNKQMPMLELEHPLLQIAHSVRHDLHAFVKECLREPAAMGFAAEIKQEVNAKALLESCREAHELLDGVLDEFQDSTPQSLNGQILGAQMQGLLEIFIGRMNSAHYSGTVPENELFSAMAFASELKLNFAKIMVNIQAMGIGAEVSNNN